MDGFGVDSGADQGGEAVVQAGAVVAAGAGVLNVDAHEVSVGDESVKVVVADAVELNTAVAVGVGFFGSGEALAIEAVTLGEAVLQAHGFFNARAAGVGGPGFDFLADVGGVVGVAAVVDAEGVVVTLAVVEAVGLVDLAVGVEAAERLVAAVSRDGSEGGVVVSNRRPAAAVSSVVVVEQEVGGVIVDGIGAELVAGAGGSPSGGGVGGALGALVDLPEGRVEVNESGGPVDGLVAVELAVTSIVVEGLAVEVEGILGSGGGGELLVHAETIVAEAIADVLLQVGVAEGDVVAIAVVLQLREVDLGRATPVVTTVGTFAEATVVGATFAVVVATVEARKAAGVAGIAGTTPATALARVVIEGDERLTGLGGDGEALSVAVARGGEGIVLGNAGVVVAAGTTEADAAGLGRAAEVRAAGGVPRVTEAHVIGTVPAVSQIVTEGSAVDLRVAHTIAELVVGFINVLADLVAVVHGVVRRSVGGERVRRGGASHGGEQEELHLARRGKASTTSTKHKLSKKRVFTRRRKKKGQKKATQRQRTTKTEAGK